MSTQGRVVVVSSANADIVVNAARIPGPGETVHGTKVTDLNGGKGANQAVAAARAGARTVFIGALGDDPAGISALAELAAEGIDTSHVQVIPGGQTGRAYITVAADSQNCIVVVPGTNALLDTAELAKSMVLLELTSADLVVLGYEVSDSVVLTAARLARAAGARVVLNPSPSRPQPAGLNELAPIIIANESEAFDLAGVPGVEDQATTIAAQTNSAVVITLGAAGAMLLDEGQIHRAVGARVTPVDTTGAGDTFAGVFCAGLAAGLDRSEALQRAVTAAGISVTVAGARSATPTTAQIDAAVAAS